MSDQIAVGGPSPAAPDGGHRTRRGLPRWLRRDPWRSSWVLEAITWGYFGWSLIPIVIAILISFNGGRSLSSQQGFSLQYWYGAPGGDPQGSLFTDPNLHTALLQSLRLAFLAVIVAVPLGVGFAVGLDRWRGRAPSTANFVMLLSFVMPEIIIAVALFLVFSYALKFVLLGTSAEVLGLVTVMIPYAVIVVRARLLSIGREYEEAAMDLGASPTQAIGRVLLPLLYPAIAASIALVFAATVDDFVTVNYLSGPAASEPLSVKIYNGVRNLPSPELNAAATFMMVSSTVIVVCGFLAYQHLARKRGERFGAAGLADQI
ncbi:MAG: ABC transporter permease [Actinobacteria bacterium]|nr:ABC transporter permease [Actinomycetota bacterium]